MSIETFTGGAWFGGWNEIGALNLLIVQSGTPNSGVFLYSGVPALGNPPIFWASTNTTDPYGNTITPTVGVAGTGQFNAGNTIINASGIFTYSGTPALGNLIASTASAAGTDGFGNAYVQGKAVYTVIGGQTFTMTMGTIPNLSPAGAGFYLQTKVNPSFSPPSLSSPTVGSGGTEYILASGASLAGSAQSSAQLEDSTLSGITNGQVLLNAGRVILGQSAAAFWDDNAQSMGLPAAGGPFISGESFHAVSLVAGLTGNFAGGVGVRVKKLPWNGIWADVSVTFTGSGGGTFTLGNLPDASYYPTVARQLPMAVTGAPSGIASAFPRLFIPTSGALQIIAPSFGAINSVGSLSTMYPTN